MPEKKAKMSRQQIQEHLKAGAHVAVGPVVHRKDAASRRAEPPLPEPPAGRDDPDDFEAVVVRDEKGRLTRAGAEHAIAHGGSVMLGGEVFASADDLPDLEEFHGRAARDAAAALDEQIGKLAATRAALAAGETAGEAHAAHAAAGKAHHKK